MYANTPRIGAGRSFYTAISNPGPVTFGRWTDKRSSGASSAAEERKMARTMPARTKSGRFRKRPHKGGRRPTRGGKLVAGPMMPGGFFYSKSKKAKRKLKSYHASQAASHKSHKSRKRGKGATFSAKRLSIKYGGKGLLRVHANPANFQAFAMDKAYVAAGAVAAITVMDVTSRLLAKTEYFAKPDNAKIGIAVSALAPVAAGVAVNMFVKQPMVNKVADKWIDAAIVLGINATIGDTIREKLKDAFDQTEYSSAKAGDTVDPSLKDKLGHDKYKSGDIGPDGKPVKGYLGNLFLPGQSGVLSPRESAGLFLKEGRPMASAGTFVLKGTGSIRGRI